MSRPWVDRAILIGAVCVAVLIVGILYLLMTDGGRPDAEVFRGTSENPPDPLTRVPAADLTVGDCLNLPESAIDQPGRGADDGTAVTLMDCAEEHDAEVYATTEVLRGVEDWPGDETLRQWAQAACADLLTDVPDVAEVDAGEEPALTLWFTYPTRDSWREGNGSRHAICVVFDPTGPMVGSLGWMAGSLE